MEIKGNIGDEVYVKARIRSINITEKGVKYDVLLPAIGYGSMDSDQIMFTEPKEEQKRQGGFLRFYFHTDGKKCCGCFPLLRQIRKGFKELSYGQCLVCGRKTDPVDDYSWTDTKKQWEKLMEEENGD